MKDARRKADDIWDAQLLMWQAKLDGRSDDARAAYEAMRKIAQSRGFSYLPVSEVAKLSDEALLSRIEAVQTVARVPSKDEASALLGTVENPPLRISEVWDEFFKLSSDARMGRSADQIRKWGNPIKLALNNWIAVNGNGERTSIRREDFINFREF